MPVDVDAINDAHELLSLRWRPTWMELTGPYPEGISHLVLMLWTDMANAKNAAPPAPAGSLGAGPILGDVELELEDELE